MSGVQVLQGALNHQILNSARKRPDNWLETVKTADFRVEFKICGRFAKNAINKCSMWLMARRFRRSTVTSLLVAWACKKVLAKGLEILDLGVSG